MKRFISIFLIVLMLGTVLVGCGNGKNVSEDSNGAITDNTDGSQHSTSESTRESSRETSRETSGITQSSSVADSGSESGRSVAPRGLMTDERF